MNQPTSYEDIDILVMDYKNKMLRGDSTASESLSEIITLFDGYILKWTSILTGHNPNISDGESVAFLTLFGHKNVFTTVEMLRDCYSKYEKDEMYNEVLVKFIDKIVFFDKLPYASFTHYISTVFKYDMFRMVMSRYREVVDCKNTSYYSTTDDYSDYRDTPGISYMVDTSDDIVSMVPLPESLKSLESCFPSLNPMERNVLRMFSSGVSYEDIANMLGVTRRSIVRRVKSIKNKLSGWADEQALGN